MATIGGERDQRDTSGSADSNSPEALSRREVIERALIPVRRSGVHPDEPRQDMEWGREPGRVLLEANPELQLHHMHDPNQDRLMIQRMTYFRVKRLRLGEAYRRFMEESLLEGGTIFLVECQLQWPTTRVAERHFFLPGAHLVHIVRADEAGELITRWMLDHCRDPMARSPSAGGPKRLDAGR